MGDRVAVVLVVALLLGLSCGGVYIGVANGILPFVEYVDDTGDTETTQGTVQEIRYYETGAHTSTDLFIVDITYNYTVDGETYTGTTVWADGDNAFQSEKAAQDFVRAHPQNSTVSVYHMPSDPTQSYLEQTTLTWMLFQTVGALLFGGLLVFSAVMMVRD